MSKRDLAFLSAAAETDLEPRTKRRKDAKSEEQDINMADATTAAGEEKGEAVTGAAGPAKEEVKEQGLSLWQAVKDAVNKDGLILSHEFMRLPSKRQYPDYYELIKRPMSLDEIKKGLDHGSYESLEQVKSDLGQCFNNAKKYNARDSQIWLDAKFLHKVTKTEYARMTGTKEEDHANAAEEEGGEKGGGDKGDGDGPGDGKKAKVPNLYRQLKGRLQKLIDKSDEEGRVLSTLFMELPLKKDYPTYYKEIKKPQSFENIFKHLKRKEYLTSAEFAADIELVFSNALTFNLEHSPVWNDAVTLREYFRQLMSDLPAPFALPEYAKPPRVSNKIKLKMPAANQSSGSGSSPTGPSTTAHPGATFTMRVPGGNETTKPSPVTNANALPKPIPTGVPPAPAAPPKQPAPSTSFASQLPVAPMTSQTYTLQPIQATPRQGIAYQYTPQHYPNASYQPPVNGGTPAPSTAAVTTSALPTVEALSYTKSPSPSNKRPLRGVTLVTKPRGRPFKLDYREGVKTWAMRLGQGEGTISVADVRFLGEEEEEQGSDEEMPNAEEEEEEEEEEEPTPRNGKGKAKRGRGRPKASARVEPPPKPKVIRTLKPTPRKTTTPLHDSVKVLLNGSIVQEKQENEGEWDMELRLGSNLLEVGEEGGMIWKVYMERVSAF